MLAVGSILIWLASSHLDHLLGSPSFETKPCVTKSAAYNGIFLCITVTSSRVKSSSSTWRSSRGRRARVPQLRSNILSGRGRLILSFTLGFVSPQVCYVVLQTWWTPILIFWKWIYFSFKELRIFTCCGFVFSWCLGSQFIGSLCLAVLVFSWCLGSQIIVRRWNW